MSRNILVVGHSHLGAIRHAGIIRREKDPECPRVRTIYMFDKKFGEGLANTENGLAPALAAAIQEQVESLDPIIASAIRGNGYSVISLIQKRRWDFELSGDDTFPLDPEATILTEEAVRDMLQPQVAADFREFRLYRDLVGPFWHLSAPPPVRRNDWIEERAEQFFTQQPEFRALGIAPAGVRYRVWKLTSRMIQDELAAIGCRFVPVPADVVGEKGMLRPSFGADATHASHHFGEAMLRELERLSA